jgi:hypothetical protein
VGRLFVVFGCVNDLCRFARALLCCIVLINFAFVEYSQSISTTNHSISLIVSIKVSTAASLLFSWPQSYKLTLPCHNNSPRPHQTPSTANQTITMSYKAGIVKAISELKDRTGSSTIAIKKHMQANMPADKKWMNGTFLKALKDGVAAGEFVQVKNSYKLSAGLKGKINKKVS